MLLRSLMRGFLLVCPGDLWLVWSLGPGVMWGGNGRGRGVKEYLMEP